MWFCSKLGWNVHIDYIAAKHKKMLDILHRSTMEIDHTNVRRLLYTTWFKSKLEHTSQVWLPYKTRFNTKLQKIQRRASRIILGNVEYKERLIMCGEIAVWPFLQSFTWQSTITI